MAKRITVGGKPCCADRWVHFNGNNAISIQMAFPDAQAGPQHTDSLVACFSALILSSTQKLSLSHEVRYQLQWVLGHATGATGTNNTQTATTGDHR
jgi:hypothetical protein